MSPSFNFQFHNMTLGSPDLVTKTLLSDLGLVTDRILLLYREQYLYQIPQWTKTNSLFTCFFVLCQFSTCQCWPSRGMFYSGVTFWFHPHKWLPFGPITQRRDCSSSAARAVPRRARNHDFPTAPEGEVTFCIPHFCKQAAECDCPYVIMLGANCTHKSSSTFTRVSLCGI